MTIGIDIGGTNIRAGVISNGTIIDQNQLILADKHSLEGTLDQLIGLVAPFTVHYPIEGIGIGVPSVVDIPGGIVYDVANIPSWKRVELKRIMEKRFGLPTYINNDVNCFVLGEYKFGLGKNVDSLVGITLGTGMGSGIIIHDRLYNGFNCGAGEIGLIPYLDGNLEAYVGSQFFIKKANKSAHLLWEEAKEGNETALAIWSEFGAHLGEALKIVLYTYDPEAIVIGGSIAIAHAYFEESMHAAMANFAYPNILDRLRIWVSEIPHIALLGAASLVSHKAVLSGKPQNGIDPIINKQRTP